MGLFQDFAKTYADLRARPYFQFVPFLPDDVLDFTQDNAVTEMHDRMIAGLARRLGFPLITSDANITASALAQIVW